MLDLRWVVANLDEAKRRLATRSADAAAALAPIEQLAAERKALIQATETRRAEQKKASERMRTLRGDEQARLRAELKTLSDEVKEKEARLKEVEERIEEVFQRLFPGIVKIVGRCGHAGTVPGRRAPLKGPQR